MNESQKNKRRIALAVPKIKLERKNNKSQVLTIGVGRTTILRGGADLGVIIHSTWRQTHCCIDNDSKYTMTWHPTRLLVVLYLIMRYYKVPKSIIIDLEKKIYWKLILFHNLDRELEKYNYRNILRLENSSLQFSKSNIKIIWSGIFPWKLTKSSRLTR